MEVGRGGSMSGDGGESGVMVNQGMTVGER